MGKKSGGSAPGIDPAFYEALDKQKELLNEQNEWFKDEMYPWAKETTVAQNSMATDDRTKALQNTDYWQSVAADQINRQNVGADTQSALNTELLDYWRNNYVPRETALLNNAAQYDEGVEAERQAQLAIGDVSNAYALARQQNAMQMGAYGINPTSGAYQAQQRASYNQQAAATAAAMNKARTAASELGWNKNAQLAALGQGYLGQGAAGLQNSVANNAQSANAAISASTGSLQQANTYGQQGLTNISGLTQLSLGNYGSLTGGGYGDIANSFLQSSTYKNNQYQDAANRQSSTSGALIGGAATVAAGALVYF